MSPATGSTYLRKIFLIAPILYIRRSAMYDFPLYEFSFTSSNTTVIVAFCLQRTWRWVAFEVAAPTHSRLLSISSQIHSIRNVPLGISGRANVSGLAQPCSYIPGVCPMGQHADVPSLMSLSVRLVFAWCRPATATAFLYEGKMLVCFAISFLLWPRCGHMLFPCRFRLLSAVLAVVACRLRRFLQRNLEPLRELT